ncbi:MAG: hypothetical protein EXQ98_03445 [Alphaproteobacteria bacterium]|nr:hypothetical protein [Alphaproteobacteria bacterium]
MPSFSYLLPAVGLGPPPGYRVSYALPIASIRDRLTIPSAQVRAIHRLWRDGTEIATRTAEIQFDGPRSSIQEWVITIDDDGKADWDGGTGLSYWELELAVASPGGFSTNQPAANYTLFSGPRRKTFFNDNAIKFGDPVTIHQVRELGAWCAGYPCCGVDPDANADESIVLINPYHRPGLVNIELVGLPNIEKIRVEPMSARRVSIARLLGPTPYAWRGQVFVTGRSRLIVFFAKHALDDPSEMTTLEHPDLYRGEPTHEALTQRWRRWAGRQIMRS